MSARWLLQDPTLDELVAICGNMRQDEIEQHVAMAGGFDPLRTAADRLLAPGTKFSLLTSGGMLLVAGGFEEIRSGVWRTWMVSFSGAWEGHWRTITAATREVYADLFRSGARRIETYVLAERTDTRNWYERGLRMRLDGVLPQYANDGRDVAVYSRTLRQIEQETGHVRRR